MFQVAEERCSLLRCPYGTLRYWDDRTRCIDCYCNEPCYGVQCPLGTKCSVELYRQGEGGAAGNADDGSTAYR